VKILQFQIDHPLVLAGKTRPDSLGYEKNVGCNHISAISICKNGHSWSN